jgi:chemotaxis protein methyltransferase CheR
VQLSAASAAAVARLFEERTGQQLGAARSWRLDAALATLLREEEGCAPDSLEARLSAGGGGAIADRLVEALLNNETYFFRDRDTFQLLVREALPRLAAARSAERRLRIWCAGCSTGQEIYSLAIALAEERLKWAGWTIDLLGTDVSAAALERAREGLYTQFEVQRGLPATQMIRWFEREESGDWRIAPALRSAVRFERHNLLAPAPPPGTFDLVLCRNVLLYFGAEARRSVFERLARACASDGLLMLGAGETVGGRTSLFAPDEAQRGFCRPAACQPRAACA